MKGFKKNERKRAFLMAHYAQRYRYQLIWYRYQNVTATFFIMGTGTN